jgi:serine/threonine protein kinase
MTSTSESYSTRHHRPKLAPGTVLQNRYVVVRQLGKGGMGAVYEATDSRLDATVAIKEAFSSDARLRKQFEQEARLLARLHHPALPRVTDYFSEGERVFLVMQFITGHDLAEIIAQQPGPLPRNTVIAWADQLLDALIYLHTRERQIIHRDIKPHNLKLTADGRIALLDFGLAKADSGASTANSMSSVFGFTRRYSPPEQMKDQGTSPQSDIYALGATLYQLLTGVKPPDALVRAGAIARSQPDPLQPATEIYPAVGHEVSAMLSKALELNAQRRFKDAHEFRQALKRLGRDEMRALENWTERGTTDRAGRPHVNVTVFKPRSVDPFDSYSILKPAEMDWLLPKPTRRPLVAVALIGLILIGGVFAFSDANEWPDFPTAAVDFVKADDSQPNPAAAEPRPKPAKPQPAGNRVLTSGSARTSPREEDRKAKSRKTDKRNANAKPR